MTGYDPKVSGPWSDVDLVPYDPRRARRVGLEEAREEAWRQHDFEEEQAALLAANPYAYALADELDDEWEDRWVGGEEVVEALAKLGLQLVKP